MFWNKKEETFRTLFKLSDSFFAHRERGYPGYKDETMKTAKRLAFYEDLQEANAKLNLILNHLKLKYVPETETKQPAKLVEKEDWGFLMEDLSNCPVYVDDTPRPVPPKKKGRPKKK